MQNNTWRRTAFAHILVGIIGVILAGSSRAETRAIADSHLNAFYGVNTGPPVPMCASGLGATTQRLLFVGQIDKSATLLDADMICAPAATSETAGTTDCATTGGTLEVYACASTESKVDGCLNIGNTDGTMNEAANGDFAVANDGAITDGDELWIRPPTGLGTNAPYSVCLTFSAPPAPVP